MLFGIGVGAMRLLLTGTGTLNIAYQMATSALESAVNLPMYVFTAAVYVTLRESKDKQAPEQTAAVFG